MSYSDSNGRLGIIMFMIADAPVAVGSLIGVLVALPLLHWALPIKRKGLSPYKAEKLKATMKRIQEIEAMAAFGSTGLALPAHVFKEYIDLLAQGSSLYRESQEPVA